MSSYSEWEMMCIDEDIEPGDTVIAEHLVDKSKTKLLVFMKENENNEWIIFKADDGSLFYFNCDSLDQRGKRTKQWKIKGKSKVELDLRKIRQNQKSL
jgi:hypothetical protein